MELRPQHRVTSVEIDDMDCDLARSFRLEVFIWKCPRNLQQSFDAGFDSFWGYRPSFELTIFPPCSTWTAPGGK